MKRSILAALAVALVGIPGFVAPGAAEPQTPLVLASAVEEFLARSGATREVELATYSGGTPTVRTVSVEELRALVGRITIANVEGPSMVMDGDIGNGYNFHGYALGKGNPLVAGVPGNRFCGYGQSNLGWANTGNLGSYAYTQYWILHGQNRGLYGASLGIFADACIIAASWGGLSILITWNGNGDLFLS